MKCEKGWLGGGPLDFIATPGGQIGVGGLACEHGGRIHLCNASSSRKVVYAPSLVFSTRACGERVPLAYEKTINVSLVKCLPCHPL